MPLTPKNRKEEWLEGLVEHETTLTPKNRCEAWMKEIIDTSGGGGGGGATVLTATVDENYDATLPCTAAELYALVETGSVLVKLSAEFEGVLVNDIYAILKAEYFPDGSRFGMDEYSFSSNGFDITCATGSNIPTWNIA